MLPSKDRKQVVRKDQKNTHHDYRYKLDRN